MDLILITSPLFFIGVSLVFWIKFRAANHTAKTLLDKLKNTATELDETKRQLASVNLTLDALRLERTHPVIGQHSQNGSANGQDNKKRRYSRKPKNQ